MAVVASQLAPVSMHQWDPLGRYNEQATAPFRQAQSWPSEPAQQHGNHFAPSGSSNTIQTGAESFAHASMIEQQDARRGSDEQGNKKRPQSCDVCRIRKVKCVLVDGTLPGQTKCKQCKANNVSCTYAYVPKRPGPQTSSAKSIARREEKERQARAAAVAAAARAAGFHDKVKARRRTQFHEGTGSTPPSSNEASRKSSAAVSRHGSPSSIALDLRHLDFQHGMPVLHHYQTGLYETPASGDVSGYGLDSGWGSGFTTDSYLSATSTPTFDAESSTSTVTPTATANRHAGPSQGHGSCLHPTLSRKSSRSDMQPSMHAGTANDFASKRAAGYPTMSMSRPASPSLAHASWSGCLHGSMPLNITPDPLEALKSLSRPSSPRGSMLLPAADFLHPLTEPLHSLSFAQAPFAPQSIDMEHSQAHMGSRVSCEADLPSHRLSYPQTPLQAPLHSQDASIDDATAATSSAWHGARPQSMFLPAQWQPHQQPHAPGHALTPQGQRLSAPLPAAQGPSSHAAAAIPMSSAPPTALQMWHWNFPASLS